MPSPQLWTWVGLDAQSKLAVSWYVGGRDSEAAMIFMDISPRCLPIASSLRATSTRLPWVSGTVSPSALAVLLITSFSLAEGTPPPSGRAPPGFRGTPPIHKPGGVGPPSLVTRKADPPGGGPP